MYSFGFLKIQLLDVRDNAFLWYNQSKPRVGSVRDILKSLFVCMDRI